MTLRSQILVGAVWVALFAGFAGAQDEAGTESSADQRFQALMAGVETALNEYIAAGYQRDADWNAAAAKAAGEGVPPPSMPEPMEFPPKSLIAEHVALFEKAALELAGDDDAIQFLGTVISMGELAGMKQNVLDACKTLSTTYAKSSKIGDALITLTRCAKFIGKEEIDRTLRAIELANPDGDLQARAILIRIDSDLRDAPVSSPEYVAARAEAMRAATLAKDSKIKSQARQSIAEREKLDRGMKATDIAGVDLHGQSFRLSDYKGKIIVLDFWGDW